MIYKVYRPGPPLAQYVDWLWFYAGFQPDHRMERMLPDGTFELVINLRDDRRKLFANETGASYREYHKAWLSGAHSKSIFIDAVPNSSMIGAHFKPGGASAFFPMSAREMWGRVEEIDAIWGNTSRHLRDELIEERTPGQKFKVLETFLLRLLRHDAARPAKMMRHVQLFCDAPQVTNISQAAAGAGVSQKHFTNEFVRCVGLTPKRFCRIRRFQRALAEINSQRRVRWADLASDTGYYDQAHFIREFQEFSGLNPSSYLAENQGYANYIPVMDRG